MEKITTNNLSQKKTAIIIRILYVAWVVVGMFSLMYVPSKLIVFGNAGETVSNILANDLLFRAGIAGSLITQLIFIATVLMLYKLFKKVSKSQSMLMVVLALVSVPIAMLNTLNQVAVATLLNGSNYLNSFTTEQINSLVMFFLDLNLQGIIIASIFWGLWLFPLGYLVYKSGYLPKFVGVALIVGGVGYVIDSFLKILLPSVDATLVTEILIMGEMVFVLWIILIGAKLPKEKYE